MKNIIALMLVFCCLIAGAAFADPPANDECADAQNAGTLVSGYPVQLSGTSVDATQDCMMGEYPLPEVWAKFTITDCMSVTIDFCDDSISHTDLINILYTECPCGVSIYASSQETCTNDNPSFTWNYLDAGTYYYPILADNYTGADYTINIIGEDCPEAPTNDNCADAIAIGEVTDYEFHTVEATFDGDGTCNTGPNVWYIYTPSFTGDAVFSLCGSDYNTILTVYDGVSCETLPAELGCNDNYSPCGNTSLLILAVVVGNQYLVEIGGAYDEYGSGVLTIEEYETPVNDDCSDATDAGTLTIGEPVQLTGDNALATQDCEELDDPEVWIKFTIEDSMEVTIDYCGTTPAWGSIPAYSRKLFTDCPCGSYLTVGDLQYCEDDNFSYTWSCLAEGTYYYPIVLTSDSYGQYNVNILAQSCATPQEGACCYDDGMSCDIFSSEEDCVYAMGGTWMGYGTDCTDADVNGIADVCEEPSTGACCYEGEEGTECVETDEESCNIEYDGDWMGYGTDCTDADVNGIADVCEEPDTYNYLPGDANMAAETWPAQTIGGDVTYLVNYFRGLADPCNLDGFYASADATGDCMVVGGDVTYLVNYFRGLNELNYCTNYEPAWPTPSDVPTDAPDGWPNCD